MKLLARTGGDPRHLLPSLRQKVWKIDPDQPVAVITTLERLYADAIARPRLTAALMGLFGAVALLLAATGIYSLLAHGVSGRRQEIGVRMALGAGRARVLAEIVGEGLQLAAFGLLLGALAAIPLIGLLESLLFENDPHDVRAFGIAPILLLVVAIAATWLPALRASRITPASALRDE